MREEKILVAGSSQGRLHGGSGTELVPRRKRIISKGRDEDKGHSKHAGLLAQPSGCERQEAKVRGQRRVQLGWKTKGIKGNGCR